MILESKTSLKAAQEPNSLLSTKEIFESRQWIDTIYVDDKIKDYIVNVRFAKQIDKQICQSVVAHLKYQLSSIELSKKSDDEAKASLNAALQKIDYEKTKSEQEAKFREPLDRVDYAGVLRVFNEKGLINSIGHFFDLNDKAYCSTMLALLNGNMRNEIVKAIEKYLPTEIPR